MSEKYVPYPVIIIVLHNKWVTSVCASELTYGRDARHRDIGSLVVRTYSLVWWYVTTPRSLLCESGPSSRPMAGVKSHGIWSVGCPAPIPQWSRTLPGKWKANMLSGSVEQLPSMFSRCLHAFRSGWIKWSVLMRMVHGYRTVERQSLNEFRFLEFPIGDVRALVREADNYQAFEM